MSVSQDLIVIRNDPDILRFVSRPGNTAKHIIDWNGGEVIVKKPEGRLDVTCEVKGFSVGWRTSERSGASSFESGKVDMGLWALEKEVTVTLTKSTYVSMHEAIATATKYPFSATASQHILREKDKVTAIRDHMASLQLPDLPTTAELTAKKEVLDQVVDQALLGIEQSAEVQQLKEVGDMAKAAIDKWMPWAKLRDALIAKGGEELVNKMVERVGEEGWEGI